MKFMRNIKSLTVAVLSIIMLSTHLIAPLQGVEAVNLRNRSALLLDDNLSDASQHQFALPTEILFAKVEAPISGVSNPDEWFSLLYYYSITRLNFADIPYNYLIDERGNIYEGHSGGDAVIPELADPTGSILVGYLSTGSELTLPAKQAVSALVSEKSAKYGISREGVKAVDLEIVSGEGGALSKLKVSDSNLSSLRSSVNSAISGTTFSESNNLQYKAEVADLQFVTSSAMNEKVPVTLTLKNTGRDPWFTFNDFLFLTIKNGEDSAYAVNQEWDAFDTPLSIEDITVLPGQDTEVGFEMQMLFQPGLATETFIFKRSNGAIIEGSEFTVAINVEAGDVDAVEITDTGAGFLNVRSAPSTGSTVIGQVNVGDIHLYTAIEAGWYRIKFDGEREGWVIGLYVRELQ